jgi:apolipoprotein N-acyltransferase
MMHGLVGRVCAEQHAAHSVLRAIETQRPFLRCGNAGWSGWIDSNGYQREVLRMKKEVFILKAQPHLSITISPNQFSKASFYVRYGDWFAYICVILTLASLPFVLKKSKINFLV